MIHIQVSQKTKAELKAIARDEFRSVSNLCFLVIETGRLGKLQLGNDEGTPWAASAPVSRDPKTARINIRCDHQWKQNVKRRAANAEKTVSNFCNHLLERFVAAPSHLRMPESLTGRETERRRPGKPP